MMRYLAIVVHEFRKAAFPCCHLSYDAPWGGKACPVCGRSTFHRLSRRWWVWRRFRRGNGAMGWVPRGRDVLWGARAFDRQIVSRVYVPRDPFAEVDTYLAEMRLSFGGAARYGKLIGLTS